MKRIWQKLYGKMPKEVDYKDKGTVADLLANAVKTFGEKPAYHCFYKSLNFNDIGELSTYFSAFLQNKLHLVKGDRVAVMLPNTLVFPVVLFGIVKAGLVQVNVNPMYTPRELAHQLNDSEAETIVIFSAVTPTLAAIISETKIKNIITVGLDDLVNLNLPSPPSHPEIAARAIPFTRALSEGEKLEFLPPKIEQSDLLFLQYTGGTTGLSKGAMLTHGNLISNIETFGHLVGDNLEVGNEVIITAIPLYHILALMVNLLCYFKAGAHNILITNPRDMPAFVKEWSRWNVTAFTGVNTLFMGLLYTPGFEKLDFSKLRLSMGGGSAVQRAVSDKWKALTGKHIKEGYGLSETSPILTFNLINDPEFRASIGIPVPSTDISLRDDAGNEVAIGEPGELCAKGPQVMQGYWRREKETADVMTKDGYFKTGDIATVDKDGYFKIIDRKKDMILVSGFNVFPAEIEDVMASLPGVIESACVGVPDAKTGEAVKLFVAVKDETIDEAKVMAHCRANLTAYKVPKTIVFLKELPKSTVGKILRRELRDI